jgi:hypothetical protein
VVGLVRQTTQTAFDPVVYTENTGGERIPVDYGVLHEAASAGDVTAVEGFLPLTRRTYSNLDNVYPHCSCNLMTYRSMLRVGMSAAATTGWVAKYGESYVDTPNRGSGGLHYAASNGRIGVRRRKHLC